jgi:deoxyxylulose-5-phosphate synthase
MSCLFGFTSTRNIQYAHSMHKILKHRGNIALYQETDNGTIGFGCHTESPYEGISLNHNSIFCWCQR